MIITFYSDYYKEYVLPFFEQIPISVLIKRIICNNWLLNCQYKPNYVLQNLDRYNIRVIWMDIDTKILSFEKLEAAIDTWKYDEIFALPHERLTVESRVLGFNLFHKAFIKKWSDNCLKYNVPDHDALGLTIAQLKPKIQFIPEGVITYKTSGRDASKRQYLKNCQPDLQRCQEAIDVYKRT